MSEITAVDEKGRFFETLWTSIENPHCVIDCDEISAKDEVLVIGDVHGCFDELCALLRECNAGAASDGDDGATTTTTTAAAAAAAAADADGKHSLSALSPHVKHIVLVGDLVNKGPKSIEVLDFMMRQRPDSAGRRFYAVRGNHDDAALYYHAQRALKRSARVSTHTAAAPHVADIATAASPCSAALSASGSPTLPPENARVEPVKTDATWLWTDDLSDAHLAYLRSLPLSLTIAAHNVVVVHAGLVPRVALRKQHALHLTKMRHVRALSEKERVGEDGDGATLHSTVRVAGDFGVLERIDSDAHSVPWARAYSESCKERTIETMHAFNEDNVNRKEPPLIVFGHDAKSGLQETPRAIGLDSGCCYGNALTGYLLRAKQLKQVRALRAYSEKTG